MVVTTPASQRSAVVLLHQAHVSFVVPHRHARCVANSHRLDCILLLLRARPVLIPRSPPFSGPFRHLCLCRLESFNDSVMRALSGVGLAHFRLIGRSWDLPSYMCALWQLIPPCGPQDLYERSPESTREWSSRRLPHSDLQPCFFTPSRMYLATPAGSACDDNSIS